MSEDHATRYNNEILKNLDKMKRKNNFYSNLNTGSKIFNAVTGVEYPFLSGSRFELQLWKVICADKSSVLYYDSPEEWLRHKKKTLRYDSEDLKSTKNIVLWYEPSEEDVISMKANGKKKIPKYLPKVNPEYRLQWEQRKTSISH
jgi:hypothetical protein